MGENLHLVSREEADNLNLRDRMCPKCFLVIAKNGKCGCDD